MPASPPLPLLLPAVDLSDAEAATEQAGLALEAALLPLFVYCEKTQSRAELSDYLFRHLNLIRMALDAVAAYDLHVQQLLAATRANVTGLNRQLHHAYLARPQPEKSHLVDWESIALSLLDRLRNPTDAPASPLVARLRQQSTFVDNLVRLEYPLEARQDLAAISAHHLPTPTAHAA